MNIKKAYQLAKALKVLEEAKLVDDKLKDKIKKEVKNELGKN